MRKIKVGREQFVPPFPWMQLANDAAYVFGDTGHDLAGFKIEHVAKALSQINRYTGHTAWPYSVAQHSVLVSKLLDFDPRLAMLGLAHDAHEVIIGDISSPLKGAFARRGLERALLDLQEDADEVVFPLFGVTWTDSDFEEQAVKRADMVALATEVRDLMVKRHAWKLPYPPHHTKIKKMTAGEAERAFMRRFRQLKRALNTEKPKRK